MARLIDADELRSDMYEYVFPITSNNLMGAADAYYRILHLLDDAPTVDAVEVVRCERCEFWINEMYSNHLEGYCEIQERCTEYDEFCSHGTKMDGGDK